MTEKRPAFIQLSKSPNNMQSFLEKFNNSPWKDESAQTFAHLETEIHFRTLLELSTEENEHIQK